MLIIVPKSNDSFIWKVSGTECWGKIYGRRDYGCSWENPISTLNRCAKQQSNLSMWFPGSQIGQMARSQGDPCAEHPKQAKQISLPLFLMFYRAVFSEGANLEEKSHLSTSRIRLIDILVLLTRFLHCCSCFLFCFLSHGDKHANVKQQDKTSDDLGTLLHSTCLLSRVTWNRSNMSKLSTLTIWFAVLSKRFIVCECTRPHFVHSLLDFVKILDEKCEPN